jgi:hypothetical protein
MCPRIKVTNYCGTNSRNIIPIYNELRRITQLFEIKTRHENLAHAFRAIDVGKEEVTEHWYDQLFLISHDVAFTEVTDQILTLE